MNAELTQIRNFMLTQPTPIRFSPVEPASVHGITLGFCQRMENTTYEIANGFAQLDKAAMLCALTTQLRNVFMLYHVHGLAHLAKPAFEQYMKDINAFAESKGTTKFDPAPYAKLVSSTEPSIFEDHKPSDQP